MKVEHFLRYNLTHEKTKKHTTGNTKYVIKHYWRIFYLLLLAASRLTLVLSQEDHLAHPMLIGAILNFWPKGQRKPHSNCLVNWLNAVNAKDVLVIFQVQFLQCILKMLGFGKHMKPSKNKVLSKAFRLKFHKNYSLDFLVFFT